MTDEPMKVIPGSAADIERIANALEKIAKSISLLASCVDFDAIYGGIFCNKNQVTIVKKDDEDD